MPIENNCLIIVKGKDKTDSIESYTFHGNKCDIVYSNSAKVFCYNSSNIKLLKLVRTIDPRSVIFKANNRIVKDIDHIQDFGEFYRVVRSNGKTRTIPKVEVELEKNCLYGAKSQELFDYFKETASTLSLKTDGGINILQRQYDMISAVSDVTVLAKYLDPSLPIDIKEKTPSLISMPLS